MPTLIHLTDLHLYAYGKQKLRGVQTLASFRAVKSLAWQIFPSPDLLLLGGDLAQDELADTYRVLGDDLLGWSNAVRVTPGNHCCPSAMERTLFHTLSIPPMAESEITLDCWQIIPLDSHHAPSSPNGRLGETELDRLERLLRESIADHLLLAMHHHPVPVDCPWMDAMMLEDADRFWELVDQSPKVRAVLFGHVHQEVDRSRGAVRLLATPATSIQFKPRSSEFVLDPLSPGFRSLQLCDDGSIQTTVHRVEGFLPDLNDTGFY